ncbi:MAG: hypothetical protein ACYST6_07560 [Planctomycetota bacterium]|jgi:hypothetical protein
MIKTLRITSIIAAILAAGFIVFPMIFGFRSDEDIERFLNSPSVIDRYRQKGDKPQPDVETSPLVAQAMKFAGYINPPKPVPSSTPQVGRRTEGPVGPPPPIPEVSTAKFNVVATSYHESRPDMSVALIDQPGAGRRWVREGAKVMHLTVEQIKEGAIMVKGGQGVFELAVPKVREVNLLDDGSPSASAGVPASVPASIASSLTLEAPVDTGGRITQPVPPGVTEEERARAEKIFAELEAMGMEGEAAAGGPGSQSKVSPRQGAAGSPRPGPEGTRIGDKEAEKLADLGKELKKVRPSDNPQDRYRRPSTDRERGRNLKDPRERINQRLEERRKKIEALAQKRMRRKQAPEDQKRPEE